MKTTTQTIINASCDTLVDPSRFDTMISDPPYSDHVHGKAVSQSKRGGARSRDLGFRSLTPELRSKIAWAASKVKRWSLIYSDVEGLHDWRLACIDKGAQYIRPIPWVRWSMPQLSGDRPPSGCEMVSLFWGSAKGKKSWSGPGNLLTLTGSPICLEHTCLRGDCKHGTEKPLDQALDLVSWFSRPDDHVLDMTSGSGVIGLACKILGRSFTGYELDPSWAESAQIRIDAPTLSKRDSDRYERWLKSNDATEASKNRMRDATAKARANMAEERTLPLPFE